MRRHSPLIGSVLLLSAFTYAACGDDDTNTGTYDAGTGSRSNAATGTSGHSGAGSANRAGTGGAVDTGESDGGEEPSSAPLTDPEIVSVMLTANTIEVQQSMIAMGRAQSKDVRSFAEDMVVAHSAALERTKTLAAAQDVTPADNSSSQALQSRSQDTVALLNSTSDPTFDETYLKSQVDVHQMVLDLLDQTLLPSAQSPILKEELTTMRSMVMMHLERATGLASGGY